MASADVEGIATVHHAEGLEDGIVVEKGLSLSHGDGVGHTLGEFLLDDCYLVGHLGGGQVALEPLAASSAKGAGHGAAYLGGEADGESLVRGAGGHPHGLDQASIRKLYHVFPRPILGYLSVKYSA